MKTRRWLGLALAVLVAAVVIAISVAGIVTKAQRDAAVANIKKPARLAFYEELAAHRKEAAVSPAAPSSGSEAAAVEATSSVSEATPAVKKHLQDAADTIARYEQMFERKSEVDERWGELYDRLSDKKPSEWTAAERAELEAFLAENRDLILELRDLAKLGGPIHPLDFSEGLNMDLSHLAKLRDCGRLLGMDAVVQALNGDYPEAVADLVAGMGLADAVGEEPIVISQLVRMAMYGEVYGAFETAFGPGELPPELVQELLQQTAPTDQRQRLADALAAEQAMGIQYLSDFLLDPAAPWGEDLDTLDRIGLQLYASPIARPFFNLDQRALAELSSQMIEVAPLPYYEARPILEEIEQDLREHPYTRIMSQQLLQGLTNVFLAQGRAEASLDLMQIGITLEQHYADSGEYPVTLDAIAADLGGAVPIDPLTGEPYHYQAQGDTFLLYSEGMNLVDDGGIHDPRDGDMVWRGEAEP